jgi:hypothetical protein
LSCHLKPSQTFTDAQLRASCPILNRKARQRVVRSAQRITGGKLPALQDTSSARCHRKPKKIIKVNNHPSHYITLHLHLSHLADALIQSDLFIQLTSKRRGQYRYIKAGTKRLRNSFYLKVIRLLNSHHKLREAAVYIQT